MIFEELKFYLYIYVCVLNWFELFYVDIVNIMGNGVFYYIKWNLILIWFFFGERCLFFGEIWISKKCVLWGIILGDLEFIYFDKFICSYRGKW